MSDTYPSNRVLNSDDIRLVRRVYDRIKRRGLLPVSSEKRDHFGGFLLEMHFRGMILEDGFLGLGVAAATARYPIPAEGKDFDFPMCRVLIVEDEYHLASEIRNAFESKGATVLEPYANEVDTLAALQNDVPDVAIVDLNLGQGVRFKVADELEHQSVPMCVVSGYSRHEFPDMPPSLHYVPWLEKPTPLDHVVCTAARILEP